MYAFRDYLALGLVLILLATLAGIAAWVLLAERTTRNRLAADAAARDLPPGRRSRGASDAIPGIERRRVRAGRPDLGAVPAAWGIHTTPHAD